jgi:rhodanese-related sulfurtransferase
MSKPSILSEIKKRVYKAFEGFTLAQIKLTRPGDYRKKITWEALLTEAAIFQTSKFVTPLPYDKDKPIYLLFSGGKGSALAAYILKLQGYTNVKLYFNDTKSEDKDLYRFVKECCQFLGYELIEDSDGRDIWQVFKENRYMGNTLVDLCSRILKRERSAKFRAQFKPEDVIFANGIDVWEEHRHTDALERWLPYTFVAPLIDSGVFDKELLWSIFESHSGIKEPYLYSIGMSHNNCGGFCVKAGLAHYRTLLENDRERYLEFEKKELEVYVAIGSKHPFLRKTINKVKHYLTLRDYRLYLESTNVILDDDDKNQFGGCMACALAA